MYKLNILTLKDRVQLDLGLAVFGDIYKLFSPEDPPKGIYLFKDLIVRALDKYSVVYSVHLSKDLTSNTYTFQDNFQDYVDGNIEEDEIELIPLEIATLGDFTSGYYWSYNKRTATISSEKGGAVSGCTCKYWAANPYKLEIGPDDEFTEDSYIYFTYPKDEDRFLVFLELEIIKKIRMIARSIGINNQIEILPEIDYIIQDLSETKRGLIRSSSNPLLMWRK